MNLGLLQSVPLQLKYQSNSYGESFHYIFEIKILVNPMASGKKQAKYSTDIKKENETIGLKSISIAEGNSSFLVEIFKILEF